MQIYMIYLLIQTGLLSFFKGIDLDNLECLFIIYPFAFEEKFPGVQKETLPFKIEASSRGRHT